MERSSTEGNRALDGSRLFRAFYLRVLGANALGFVLAYIYLGFIARPQPPPPQDERILGLVVGPAFAVGTMALGYWLAQREIRPLQAWLDEGRAATSDERAHVLSLPWRGARLAAGAWLSAAASMAVITGTHHPALFVVGFSFGVLLAGLTSTAATFLLVERGLRPVFALALAGAVPSGRDSNEARALRTGPRLVVSWALGSGIALVAIALAFLGRGDRTDDELIGPILSLVVAGLFVGGVLMAAAARSISDPVERVRVAVGRVREGSLDEQVVVDDGGEIGFLQAGFNRMVEGLRERERIRDAFGTYVDREVAEHILREGTDLAGEEVEVTMMFIDIRNFTGFAERSTAPDVVATLNRLFERIVPVIHEHGGHVDKFVGDGLLAVFGAPRRQEDHADQALAAALEIAGAVEDEFEGQLGIGVGLNSGSVVAGNVGGAGRLEFSVIGDPVNVAARVEAATRQTGDTILVAEETTRLLGDSGIPLEERPAVPLKGKRETVSLYAPEAARDRGDDSIRLER
jgi:adenylate cyclase